MVQISLDNETFMEIIKNSPFRIRKNVEIVEIDFMKMGVRNYVIFRVNIILKTH